MALRGKDSITRQIMVSLCIERLAPSDYLRSYRIETGGQIARTHLAAVRTSTGVRRAYVKAYPSGAPRGLLNEIIGYTLAHHSKLPQPMGGIVCLPGAFLSSLFPADKFPSNTVCFISIDTEDTLKRTTCTAKVRFSGDLSGAALSLMNWSSYPLMVAFDSWVANVDRNIGNLIMVARDDYWVIDNGGILTGPNWTAEDMNPLQWTLNKILDLVTLPPSIPLPIKSAIVKHAVEFLAVYGRARSELEFWLSGDSGSEELKAHHFIWHRAESTVQLLKDRLLLAI